MATLRDLSLIDPSLTPSAAPGSLRQMSLAAGYTPEQAVAAGAAASDPIQQGAAGTIQNLFSGTKGLAAGLQEAFGGNPDDLYASARRDAALAAAVGPKVQRLRDIGGAADAAGWALGTVGAAAPYLGVGIGGGMAGRNLNVALGSRLGADAAAHLGATAAYVPSMAGDQILQMKEYAPDMDPRERLVRGLGVGGLQAATEAVAPMVMMRTPRMGQPFMTGMGQQIRADAASEAASDIIGQGHRVDFQPGYQFDPMQTIEAGAAGAVGTAPFAAPGAALGHLAHVGGGLADKAQGAGQVAQQAGQTFMDGAQQAGQAAMDGMSWAGEQAYAAMPEQAKQVADYIAAGGKATMDMVDALTPYGEVLSDRAIASLTEAMSNIHAEQQAGAPADKLAGQTVANLARAGGQIHETINSIHAGMEADPNIPDVIRQTIAEGKERTEGRRLEETAKFMSDPYAWVKKDEAFTPKIVQQMRTELTNLGRARSFAGTVERYLDANKNAPEANSSRAQELRGMIEKIKRAKTLTEDEAKQFWLTTQQVMKAKNAAEAFDSVLNIGKKVRVTQDEKTGKITKELLSRQKGVLNKAASDAVMAVTNGNKMMANRIAQRINFDMLLKNGVTKEVREMRAALEKQGYPKEVFDAVETALNDKIAELTEEGVVPRQSREGAIVSDAFRKAVARELQDGLNVLGIEDTDHVQNMLVDFVAGLAEGREAHNDAAAAKARAEFERQFGKEGGYIFDNIVQLAKQEFGGIGDKRAQRVTGLLSLGKTLSQRAGEAKRLIQRDDTTISDLLEDIEKAHHYDEKRSELESNIQRLERRAIVTPVGTDARFRLNGDIARLREEGHLTGFEHLKKSWTNAGVVKAKDFDKLVTALEIYSMKSRAERRPDVHTNPHTSANHMQETAMNEEGRGGTEAPIRHSEVDDALNNDGGDEYQEYLRERAEEKYGTQAVSETAPIYWGTSALTEAGGHDPTKVGAPLSRHPSGDQAKEWNKKSSEYTNGVAEAHAKYGHRVTNGRGVRLDEWAADMEAIHDIPAWKWLNGALDALLKHDQERLKNPKLLPEDRTWIENRARLAAELGDRKFAGFQFFNDPMNSAYRYYKMEQGDASNLTYSADQLQHGRYTLRMNEHGDSEDIGAFVKRMQQKDGKVFDNSVYQNSLFLLKKDDGTAMMADIPTLVMDIMRHQSADSTGVGNKDKPNIAHELSTAFLNVMSTLMQADGLDRKDPFGILSGDNERVLANKDRKAAEGVADGNRALTLDPNLVVFRDPSGAVIHTFDDKQVPITEHMTKRAFTVGDLLKIKGLDESLKTMFKTGTPDMFSGKDIATILPETTGRISESSTKRANERGVARAGVKFAGTLRDVDVHGMLARMLERNGIDSSEALHQGRVTKALAGMLIGEGMRELEKEGYSGDFIRRQRLVSSSDKKSIWPDPRYDDMIVYYEQYGDDSRYPVTMKQLQNYIKDEALEVPRDLKDAELHEAKKKLAALEKLDSERTERIKNKEATEQDKDRIEYRKLLNDINYQVDTVGWASGEGPAGEVHVQVVPVAALHPLEVQRRPLSAKEKAQGFRTFHYSTDNNFSDSAVEGDKNDAQHDRSESARGSTAWGKKAYGESVSAEYKPRGMSEVRQLAMREHFGNPTVSSKNLPEGVTAEQIAREKAGKAASPTYSASEREGMPPLPKRDAMAEALHGALPEAGTATAAKQSATTLHVPKGPYDVSHGLTLEEQRANAKLETQVTGTNQKALEDHAFREESRAVQRRRAREEMLTKAGDAAIRTERAYSTGPMPPAEAAIKAEPHSRWNSGEAPFSRAKLAENSTPAERRTFLDDVKNQWFGDAFKWKMENQVTDKEGKQVSGKFDEEGMTAIVSAMTADRLGTLAHEGWHGVETLLNDMGEHGQHVLDEIYDHVSKPAVIDALKARFANDPGVLKQIDSGSVRELAAFTFQVIAKGETMPTLPKPARTVMQRIIDFVRAAAEKMGIGFTTNEERANNFFNALKNGEWAKNYQNAAAVRRLLGEKKGDAALQGIGKALGPLVEGFDKVFGHTADRIRELNVSEYDELMEKFTGENGKGGYLHMRQQAEIKFGNRVGVAIEYMTDAQKAAYFNSPEYSNLVTEVRQYVEKAMAEGGVPGDKKGNIINSLYSKVDSFNVDRVDDRFDEFVEDLIKHGGLKGQPGKARDIANEIVDNGFFYDGETKLFEGKPDIAAKWLSRDPAEKAARFIRVATRLAERARHFGYQDEKLKALQEAGNAKTDSEGQQLMQDFIDAVDGKLGRMTNDMKKLQGGLLFVQNVHALPLAVFSQMLEPLQLALRRNAMKGSLDAMFRGIRDMPRTFKAFNKKVNPDYWEKLAYQVGTAPHRIINDTMSNLLNGMHISGTVGKLNEKFFRYNFMEQWNRSMHVEATKHAVEFLKEAARGEHGQEHSERFLKDLGVTKEEILSAIQSVEDNGTTYESLRLTDNIERAIGQYVEEAMAHPDAGSNAMWMNDPRFALLAQMKRFTFSHSKYILDRGIKEMKLGNSFPVAPALIAMPWMLAADGLRDTLAMRTHPERANWGVTDYLGHSFERAGHAGRGQFFNDAVGAVQRGSSPVEALAGPSAEMFGDIIRGANNGRLLDTLVEYTPGSQYLPGI